MLLNWSKRPQARAYLVLVLSRNTSRDGLHLGPEKKEMALLGRHCRAMYLRQLISLQQSRNGCLLSINDHVCRSTFVMSAGYTATSWDRAVSTKSSSMSVLYSQAAFDVGDDCRLTWTMDIRGQTLNALLPVPTYDTIRYEMLF